MKKTVWLSLVVAAVMLLVPISAIETPTEADTVLKKTQTTAQNTQTEISDTFRLYDHKTEKITLISREEYIFGVIASEMPALYEVEALKAQSVAAYTYACYYRQINKNEKYDLSTDPAVSQCYITRKEAQEKWGDKAKEYSEKLDKVIAETCGYTIKYNGEIILAVYHAIAAGKTEDSGNVWGRSYPYLKSVDSSFDKDSPNYVQKATFSEEEVKSAFPKVTFSGKTENYFSSCSRYPSGYVKEIKLCGVSFSGGEIRNALNLRSSNFEITFSENKFTFTTYGYGHGVGMSQNGANALAKEGKDFKAILTHYYTDCTVSKG